MNKQKKTKKQNLKFSTLVKESYTYINIVKWPITKIISVYALLYFILILGLNLPLNYDDVLISVQETIGNNAGWFTENISVITSLFSVTTTGQSEAASLMQVFLFAVATLACIWLFKNTKSQSSRSAFYDGTSRIIPFLIVLLILLIPLIPALIGSSIFSVAQGAGAAGIELLVVGLLAGVLLLFSVYWLCAWLFSIYFVSENTGTPIASIKASLKLTKGNRFFLVRNFVLFGLCMALASFVIMLPVVLLVPALAVAIVYLLSFVLFAAAQVFLFVNFRSLQGE